MVESNHFQGLSIARQCDLLGISRSSFYYEAKGESPLNLKLMRMIDEQFLETPWYGSRQMARWLRREDLTAGVPVPGPALIMEAQTTTVVPAAFDAAVDESATSC